MSADDDDPIPTTITLHCRYCFQSFSSHEKLKPHLDLHVNRNDLHSCYFCGRRILRKDNYDMHLLQHTRELHYPCEFCGRSFINHGKYSRHTCQILNCDYCGKYFNLERSLRNHVATIHGLNSPVNCTACRVGFPDLEQFEIHTQSEGHIRKTEQLNRIEVKAKDLNDLHPYQYESRLSDLGHGVSNVPKRDWCKICCKEYRDLGLHFRSREHKLHSLKVRIKKVKHKMNRISTSSVRGQIPQPVMNTNHTFTSSYSCNFCGKTCLSKARLKGHVYTQHTAKEYLKRWCQPCEKFISSPAKFRRHLESISHRIRAEMVPTSSDDIIETSANSATVVFSPAATASYEETSATFDPNPNVPPGTTQFKCVTCGKSYGSKNSLNCHRYRKHSKYKKSFQTTDRISANVVPVPLPEKEGSGKVKDETRKPGGGHSGHTCDICGRSYPNKNTFVRHMVSHTKQFECNRCGKCFRDLYDLNRHTRQIHEKYLGQDEVNINSSA